jgi:hypothetical protein
VISVSTIVAPASSKRTGGLVAHAGLLKKVAVVTATALLALGLGAATATSASAAIAPEKIWNPTPSGEISTKPQM